MKDEKVSLPRVNLLHPKIRPLVIKAIEDVEKQLNITIRITQGLRTFKEQDALFNQSKDGKDNDGDGKIDEADEKVTNAKGGQSIHNYGLAFDIAVMSADGKSINWNYDTKKIADIIKKHGFVWGGDWVSIVDKPHFEMTFKHTWQTLKALVDKKQVDKEGYVII